MKSFESEIIRSLIGNALAPNILERVLNSTEFQVEHTGDGYFLTVKHTDLPKKRHVFDEPIIIGTYSRGEVGFVVFVEEHTLMLECHGWGDPVPSDIREHTMTINQRDTK